MHVLVDRLSRLFAILGGLVLSVLILMTCLSVLGREINAFAYSDWVQGVLPGLGETIAGLGIGPVPGDFELVEAGMAFAIFAFLPICQLQGGHASVSIFTDRLPPRVDRILQAVIEAVFAAVLVLIAWQLWLGTLSKVASGQTTFLLQFPVWWAYAASLTGAVVAALVAIYTAVLRCLEAATGRPHLPVEREP